MPLAQKVDESENIDLNLDLVRKVKSAPQKYPTILIKGLFNSHDHDLASYDFDQVYFFSIKIFAQALSRSPHSLLITL